MASKTQVLLLDDLDPSQETFADETVPFGLDGESYEIDLSAANAKTLREAVGRFVEAARTVRSNGSKPRRRTTTAKPASATPQFSDSGAVNPPLAMTPEARQQIREWANSNGFQVGTKGRIAAGVLDAYNQAH